VSNTLAVTNYLRARFHRDKIYLLAHSGGSVQGVLAVQAHPELYTAYIGAGQGVDLTASDRAQYADTLAWARKQQNSGLVKQLTAVGPPPYDNIYSYEPMLLHEGDVYAYPGGVDSGAGQAENFEVNELSLLDKVHVFSGFLDTYGVLYPRERDVDFRRQVPRLEVPAYFVEGAHDVPGRLSVMKQWYGVLQAPHKEIVTFPDVGHRSLFEDPGQFVALMTRVVAETSG
jgi:pimeloyl-ACP methyl ester carboxylesterase